MLRPHVIGALLLLVAAGCGPGVPTESVSGNGQSRTICREGEFDLTVDGNGNTVVVTGGAVRRLSAVGNGHQITVQKGVPVEAIDLNGNDITVRIPADVEPARVSNNGNNCRVVKE